MYLLVLVFSNQSKTDILPKGGEDLEFLKGKEIAAPAVIDTAQQ